jgi:hypothetical protein
MPFEIMGIKWPYQLPEKGSQNSSYAHNLAADLEKEFDLMFVDMSQYKRTINLAPFRPTDVASPSKFKSVISEIYFDIDGLPHKDSKLLFKFKVTGGDGDVDTVTQSYILKIPPLLPEHSFPDDAVKNINALMKEPFKYMPAFVKESTPE